MLNKKLVPWLGQMLLGFACFIGGLQVISLSLGEVAQWEAVAGGAALSVLGLVLVLVTEARERPQRVLRKARRSLNFPTQWAVKFDKRMPQGGGVIPVAVIRSDGVRFVIDIQEHREVEWNDPLIGEPLLVGRDGKKFKSDPAAPLITAAEAWGATAILWLPSAKVPRNLRQEGSNLIVVMGGARELKHVLRGAEIVPRRKDGDFEMTMPLIRPARSRSGKSAQVATAEMA